MIGFSTDPSKWRDEDEDDHLLVIAHRESGSHGESDHESSERSDRADDSA
jgi:hypothetical protein